MVLGLVGCRVISKILGIRPSEINGKDYNYFQHDQMSLMQSDSYDNQDILYGAANM